MSEVPQQVSISLLDPITGRPVQKWRFDACERLRIGRNPDQDVVIPDPYVSRQHAEIQFRSNAWFLIPLGQNGVLVENETISEQIIVNEIDFRLGRNGPLLRFQLDLIEASPIATLDIDADEDELFFELDDTKIQREVAEISEGDFFQSLQTKAQELRRRVHR